MSIDYTLGKYSYTLECKQDIKGVLAIPNDNDSDCILFTALVNDTFSPLQQNQTQLQDIDYNHLLSYKSQITISKEKVPERVKQELSKLIETDYGTVLAIGLEACGSNSCITCNSFLSPQNELKDEVFLSFFLSVPPDQLIPLSSCFITLSPSVYLD